MNKSLRAMVLIAALAVAALVGTSSALAAAPTGDHAKFKYCPYTNTNVQACLYSVTTSGSFKLGNANVPITGSPGSLFFPGDGTILATSGVKLVDNSFSAPAAGNCGFLPLDKLLITAAVNLKEGLPAAAGKNTAIQQGDTYVGYIDGVRASVH